MNDIHLENQHKLIREQLQTVLNSKQFANAPTVSAFLEFVVNETLNGRGQSLKAYAIAMEVFGRNSQFDPSSDTIVRTTAGRVRKALDEYYGACDPVPRVIISLPKGRYVPSFIICDVTNSLDDPNLHKQWRIQKQIPRMLWLIAVGVIITAIIVLITLQKLVTPSQLIPKAIVIDVRAVDVLSERDQSLAQEIDARLAPALARIQLAEIKPPNVEFHQGPQSSTKISNEDGGFFFTLRSTITGTSADRELLWKLIDSRSNRIMWASKEQLLPADSTSIATMVDKIAFQILGSGGAVAAYINKYPSNILSRPTCITRAQMIEINENSIAVPELLSCLKRIIKEVPQEATAWATLSSFYTLRSHFYGAGSRDERARLVELAEHSAQKAVELAPRSYLTKVALMHLSLRQGRINEFLALQREMRHHYPGDIYLHIRIATRLARLGRGREALEIFDKAQNDFGIDLKNWAAGLAVAYFAEGKYERAQRQMSRVTSDLPFVLVLRAAILGKLNRGAEAGPIVLRLLEIYPDIGDEFYLWLRDLGWSKKLLVDIADGLDKVGFKVRD
ncbi:tetratricopeptide repeat protein [Brucella sp. TWI432]